MKYPDTPTSDAVDVLHGTRVPDPYRWLEDGESAGVREWTARQNAFTRSVLDGLPDRPAILRRLAALLSTGTLTVPVVRNGRLFYQRRDPGQEQPVLYCRDGPEGPERALVDPAGSEPDAAAALDWWYPSPDGDLVACGLSRRGDENSLLSVRRADTGGELSDSIPHTRFCSLAWLPDSSGFYYTRMPEPGTVPAGEEQYHPKVYFHRLGSGWREDPEIFGSDRAPEDMLGVDLSPDGRWLCVTAMRGWSRSDVYLLDRGEPGASFVPVVEGRDALFLPEARNTRLLMRSNLDAPNYRVLGVDPLRPAAEAWEEIIPEGPDVLSAVDAAGGVLACSYLSGGRAVLRLHRENGALLREIDLPGLVSLTGVGGERARSETELYYGCVSFVSPPAVYRLRAETGESLLWQRVPSPVSAEEYETRQVSFSSRDGTSVTMFLVHRRELPRDGARPTLLNGYGGFNVSLVPSFVRSAYLLLERGGLLAVANLRGGGEYGESWHRAGMLDRKQNVFDDAAAAAEYLIREGYTCPERLAVQGGSNGGLLVGALVTQRPELFTAAVCQVPLLDMLRYQLFRIARLWIAEYGSSEDPEQFRVLHAYSPYHRIRAGAPCPAMLITAAESDTRVDPLHARKFAAAMQAAAREGCGPILLRVEERAGHGAGKPLNKVIEEQADVWSFLLWRLGVAL